MSDPEQEAVYAPITDFEQRWFSPCPGPALVVGSKLYKNRPDRRLLYAQAIGVDMLEGDGVDVVANLEDEPDKLPPSLDAFWHVDCLSVLEHSRKPWAVAANIERLLFCGGTLYLAVPFVWRVHAYPSDYFRFTVEGVKVLFPSIEWAAIEFVTDTQRNADFARQGKKDKSGFPVFPRAQVIGFGTRR